MSTHKEWADAEVRQIQRKEARLERQNQALEEAMERAALGREGLPELVVVSQPHIVSPAVLNPVQEGDAFATMQHELAEVKADVARSIQLKQQLRATNMELRAQDAMLGVTLMATRAKLKDKHAQRQEEAVELIQVSGH